MNKKFYILSLAIISLIIGTTVSASWFSDLFSEKQTNENLQVQQNLGATSLPVFQGGTGFTSATAGNVIIGDTARALSATSTLYISSNGNVGIGTTNPLTALDVNGVITATGGNSTQWNLGLTASTTPNVTVKGGVVRVIDSAAGDIARTTTGWIEDEKFGWRLRSLLGSVSTEFDIDDYEEGMR